MAIEREEGWPGAVEAVQRRFRSREAREIFSATATARTLRIAPPVAVVAPETDGAVTTSPSRWPVTAWRYFVLEGEHVVAATDVEDVEGKIAVASVASGPTVWTQVEALTRVEDDLGDRSARVFFAIVPWLFFVGLAVVTKDEEQIYVIEPGGAELERGMVPWADAREALLRFQDSRVAAARRWKK